MSLAQFRAEHPRTARALGGAQTAFLQQPRVRRCVRRRMGPVASLFAGLYLYVLALLFRCAWALGGGRRGKRAPMQAAGQDAGQRDSPRVIDDSRLNSYGRKFLQQFGQPCAVENLYDALNLAAELLYRQQDAVDRQL